MNEMKGKKRRKHTNTHTRTFEAVKQYEKMRRRQSATNRSNIVNSVNVYIARLMLVIAAVTKIYLFDVFVVVCRVCVYFVILKESSIVMVKVKTHDASATIYVYVRAQRTHVY